MLAAREVATENGGVEDSKFLERCFVKVGGAAGGKVGGWQGHRSSQLGCMEGKLK